MPTLLQIAQLGHPVLRQRATVVRDIADPEVQQLIDDLISTVNDVDGVGIAAPQVYRSQRIFILASHPSPRYPYAPQLPPVAVINPKIEAHSKEKEKDWEGCLSIPGMRALVPRWKEIDVSYQTRDGKKVTATYESFLARIFQHELDHLNGLVFFDRLESAKDIFTEKEFQKIIAEEIPRAK
jgi:peptide deformylase